MFATLCSTKVELLTVRGTIPKSRITYEQIKFDFTTCELYQKIICNEPYLFCRLNTFRENSEPFVDLAPHFFHFTTYLQIGFQF